MASINIFTLVGNLTKDPEMRYTAKGTPVASFTVAVNNVFLDREGNKQEQTDFIPVTSYGFQAENDIKYLKKGNTVAVMGSIRSWYNPEQKKGGFNFDVDKVQYLTKLNANTSTVSGVSIESDREKEQTKKTNQQEFDETTI